MARHTVELSQKYQGHDGFFDRVVLREPTYKEIFIDGLGRPQEWQMGAPGKAMLLTFPDVIDAYVQRLAVEPEAEMLAGLSAVDCMRLEKAVCGFFQEPMKPERLPPVSSSGSDGIKPASNE